MSKLESRYTITRDIKAPIDEGMVPVSEFRPSDRVRKAVIALMRDGIVPTS